jgi:uncharacterized protein
MFLPLFPLPLVVFPGEKLKLHIFEPRYIELIRECESDGITFGIPAHVEGGVSEYGTEVGLLTIFSTYDTGEMDILAEGRRVFHLSKFVRNVPERLYSGGEVDFLANNQDSAGEPRSELAALFGQFHELIQSEYARQDFSSDTLSFELAQEVGLSLVQKIRLLSMENEGDRLRFITEHLRNVVPLLTEASETRKKVRGNGRFHKFPSIEL